MGEGGQGGEQMPPVFFQPGNFFWLRDRIIASKKRQKKESEKLAFYGTDFALFKI
jgi:hypothetical protein